MGARRSSGYVFQRSDTADPGVVGFCRLAAMVQGYARATWRLGRPTVCDPAASPRRPVRRAAVHHPLGQEPRSGGQAPGCPAAVWLPCMRAARAAVVNASSWPAIARAWLVYSRCAICVSSPMSRTVTVWASSGPPVGLVTAALVQLSSVRARRAANPGRCPARPLHGGPRTRAAAAHRGVLDVGSARVLFSGQVRSRRWLVTAPGRHRP
jgi:hypothetical protein